VRVVCFGLGDEALRKRYDALFEACPHAFIQQSTAWAEVIGEIGPDRPFFLLADDGGADVAGLPLHLYESPSGRILTSVPQPGPLGGVFARADLGAEARAAAYAALLESARALAQEHECLALTLITSPTVPDTALYEAARPADFVLHNYTQVVPLDRPVRRAGGQRNNLARARKFGFQLEPCRTEAEVERWYELHRRRHEALGAVPLDRRIIDNVFRHLVPARKALFLVARDGERYASGTLYILHRDVMDVYAISMDADYADHAPNALLADASMEWGREVGVKHYNWQSSPSRQSGVYRNKEQWGSEERPYEFLTWLFTDRARLRAIGPEGARRDFPGHYLVPFAAFLDLDRVHFEKA
jgi:hypothetical protein